MADFVDIFHQKAGGKHAHSEHLNMANTKPSLYDPSVDISPVLTVDTNAYSIGDAVGISQETGDARHKLAGASIKTNGTTELENMVLASVQAATPALTFLFFNDKPSGGTYTNNAALVLSAADVAKFVGAVSVAAGDWYSAGSRSFMSKNDVDLTMNTSTYDLWCVPVADAAVTFTTATDLTWHTCFERS